MPKFGVSSYSISGKVGSGEMTPEAAVKWLAENGCEVIEIVPSASDIINTPELIEYFNEVSKSTNVPIENYSFGGNFCQISDEESEAEVKRVCEHITAASKLGVKTIRVDSVGWSRSPEINTIENFQLELPTIVKAYTALCNHAAQHNITILLENHGYHVNGSERVRQVIKGMEAAGVKNFGLQLDTGNFECVDERGEIATKKLLQFATTIHMKDFYIRYENPGDGGWFQSSNGTYLRGSILGQGDLKTRQVLKMIKESGFDGNIFLEFEGIEDCLFATKASLDNLKRIYNEV